MGVCGDKECIRNLGWWRGAVFGDPSRGTYEEGCGDVADFARRFPEWLEVEEADEQGGPTVCSVMFDSGCRTLAIGITFPH
eukprot:gene11931-biopygen3304